MSRSWEGDRITTEKEVWKDKGFIKKLLR